MREENHSSKAREVNTELKSFAKFNPLDWNIFILRLTATDITLLWDALKFLALSILHINFIHDDFHGVNIFYIIAGF